MPLTFGNTAVETIFFNDEYVAKVVFGDTTIYESAFIYHPTTAMDGSAAYGISLSEYGMTLEGEINVPSTFAGYPIIGIAESGFSGSPATKINLPDTIEVIEDDAFTACANLTYMRIPNSVIEIKGAAFSNCQALSCLEIDEENSNLKTIFTGAFYKCGFEVVVLPNSLEAIWDGAFEDCSNLTFAYIPDNVTYIAGGAFNNTNSDLKIYCGAPGAPNSWESGWNADNRDVIWNYIPTCHDYFEYTLGSKYSITGLSANPPTYIVFPLAYRGIRINSINCAELISGYQVQRVRIPGTCSTIGESTFALSDIEDVLIEDGVTTIEDYAFSECGYLSTVIMRDSVISIGDSAFADCTSLTTIELSNNLSSAIGGEFSGCTSLASIELPLSLTGISDSMFENCSNLTTITFKGSSSSLQFIGNSAFNGCRKLTTITIPDTVTEIYPYAFQGCAALQNITIPSNVNSIYSYAFYDCVNLTSITLPNSVVMLGDGAFNKCSSLSSITLSNNLSSIEANTFDNCISLTSITIPNSVEYIDDNAFAYCSSLSRLDIDAEDSQLTRIGDFAFSYCAFDTVVLPCRLTSIGTEAFSNGVHYDGFVYIPQSVTAIDTDAFASCRCTIYCGAASQPSGWSTYWNIEGLSVIWGYIPTNTAYFTYSKSGTTYTITRIQDAATSIVLPLAYRGYRIDGISGNRLLASASNVMSLHIPGTCMLMSQSVFELSANLRAVKIESGLSTLPARAFYSCSKLTQVNLAASVSTIGAQAFYGSGLTSATLGRQYWAAGTNCIDTEALTQAKLVQCLKSTYVNKTWTAFNPIAPLVLGTLSSSNTGIAITIRNRNPVSTTANIETKFTLSDGSTISIIPDTGLLLLEAMASETIYADCVDDSGTYHTFVTATSKAYFSSFDLAATITVTGTATPEPEETTTAE